MQRLHGPSMLLGLAGAAVLAATLFFLWQWDGSAAEERALAETPRVTCMMLVMGIAMEAGMGSSQAAVLSRIDADKESSDYDKAVTRALVRRFYQKPDPKEGVAHAAQGCRNT